MPSGLTHEHYDFDVSEDVISLRMVITWPKAAHDTDCIFHDWYKMTDEHWFKDYHPRVLSLQNAFAQLRARASDPLLTSCVMNLPFKVCSKKGWKDNVTVEGMTFKIFDVSSTDSS